MEDVNEIIKRIKNTVRKCVERDGLFPTSVTVTNHQFIVIKKYLKANKLKILFPYNGYNYNVRIRSVSKLIYEMDTMGMLVESKVLKGALK